MPYYFKNYKKTFVYYLCPKNGCTSIANMLIQADGNIKLLDEEADNENGKEFKSTHHLADPSTNEDWAPCEAKIKLAVKRDPVERFISGFKNRILYHKDLIKTTHWLTGKFENLTSHLPEVPSMDTFIENFDTYWLNPWVAEHFQTQTHYLNKPNDYTHIFDVSELDEVRKLLEELSGKTIVLPYLQAGGNNRYLRFNREKINWIKEKYAIDYKNGWC